MVGHVDGGAGALQEQLARIPFFAHLDGDVLAELVAAAVPREYAPGAVIFAEGEPSRGLLVIERGQVKIVESSAQGREHILELLGAGQPANAVAVFTRHPSPATAIALEPTMVWLLSRSAVLQTLRAHPAFAERVIEDMADHMVRLVELVADLSLRSVTQRLAKLLLESAVDGVVARPRWYTLPELASRLGTVPDVVQRALGRLSEDGVVVVSRREIRIADVSMLERAAE